MGVVKRQGIKESIVAYVGVLIGALSTLWVQPSFLTTEEIGLLKVLVSMAVLIMPFMSYGIGLTTVKFFPYFKNESKGHNGLLSYGLLVATAGSCLVCFIFWWCSTYILAFYETDAPLLSNYLFYVLPIGVLFTFFVVFAAYARSLLRIVVPSIFSNIVLKGSIVVLVLLYAGSWINLDMVVYGLVATYGFMLLGMIGYTYSMGQLFLTRNFSFITPKLLKKMITYASYVFLAGFANTLVVQVDTVMVASLMDLSNAGVYAIAFYIGTVIEIPRRSMAGIVAPLLANAWKENDLAAINDMYKRSSITQFIVGVLLFIGIWASLEDLFTLMPNGEVFAAGKYVVFFVGLTKVLDMLTGVNSEIIVNSKYFRVNFYIILLLAVLTILTNFWLIPIYGIVGAAMATALSMLIFNMLKFLFLWFTFKMQPFSIQTFIVLGIALVSYGASQLLPSTGLVFMDIVLKSATISILFIPSILITKVSPDINGLVEKAMEQVWQK